MLAVLFFISVFSSVTWVVYISLYVVANLAGNDLSSLPVTDVALYIGLIVAPVWALWQIFGLISTYKSSTQTEKKLLQLFNQMKKNQDYTDLVVRVMLDAEHEIKDGFVVNKFDVFVADMNEILADIVQRCNAASSMQMEQLWAKVKNGERWAIAKTLVETSKSYDDFASYLAQKSQKDEVFKGTLLEFCYRYQNLTALLEKHDRDRVFITILETGVMGKVYSILAPVADATNFSVEPEVELDSVAEEEVEISPRILQMQEPVQIQEQTSFWRKINPFKKAKMDDVSFDDNKTSDEAFFMALEKSMNSPEEKHQDFKFNADLDDKKEDFPHFDIPVEPEKENVLTPRLNMNITEEKFEPYIELDATTDIKDNESTKDTTVSDNNFAYPFGGWVNEENYKK
ncbi:MAG: hypothetical protein IJF12_01650 [Alphaproteobacteria bacterium]|nr:hypothetical protein [Alphaproteobacteria bacterium]